eukprot:scaffold126506_cov50-Cyclotella_meneghiniana.AAC.1
MPDRILQRSRGYFRGFSRGLEVIEGPDSGQSENSVGKPRSRAFRIQSNLDLSPTTTDSPVVVLKGIGAELRFFSLNASFLAIFSPTIDTSTTLTMAGSLQIAAQTTPNPTNTITNASATGGGVGGIDSATTGLTTTAEAEHKRADDATEWFLTSGRKDRGRRGHKNIPNQHNNQSGCGRGYAGWIWTGITQQSAENEAGNNAKIIQLS